MEWKQWLTAGLATLGALLGGVTGPVVVGPPPVVTVPAVPTVGVCVDLLRREGVALDGQGLFGSSSSNPGRLPSVSEPVQRSGQPAFR